MARAQSSYILWVFSALIILAVIAGLLLHAHHPSKAPPQTGCVAQRFTVGSSGACVRDIQTMVNYMETAGLSECPFTDGKPLNINGTYDGTTKQQVQSVQTWINCYNKQEGSNTSIPTDGTIGSSTWPQLCSYAYRFPSQSNSSTSPYCAEAIAAGKNAGC